MTDSTLAPSSGREDKRAAAVLRTTVSAYVITAALGATAALAAIAAYVLDRRTGLTVFGVIAGLALLSLMGSVALGARATTKVYKAGTQGDWSIETATAMFSLQAGLAMLGVILVAVAAIAPGSSKQPSDSESSAREEAVLELVAQQRRVDERAERLEGEVDRLRRRIATLETRAERPPP